MTNWVVLLVFYIGLFLERYARRDQPKRKVGEEIEIPIEDIPTRNLMKADPARPPTRDSPRRTRGIAETRRQVVLGGSESLAPNVLRGEDGQQKYPSIAFYSAYTLLYLPSVFHALIYCQYLPLLQFYHYDAGEKEDRSDVQSIIHHL